MPGRRAPEAERREQILRAAFKVATQKRLDGLTIRAIADEAQVSSGLISFYFGNREGVVLTLLDWLLRSTIVGDPTPEVLALPTAQQRLLGFIKHELDMLPGRKPSMELFFDYWVLGFRQPRVRGRIRRAYGRYLRALTPLAEEVVAESPERFGTITGRALAQLVFSVIGGCVMQSVLDPRGFDLEQLMSSVAATVTEGTKLPRAAGLAGC